jgi:two-component system nitrogen regulation response regulator GlnG
MPNSAENLEIGFSKAIEKHLEKYFAMHKGGDIPAGLYRRVMTEVEKALFSATLKLFKGNQQKTAKALGISRSTLRKKMFDSGENNT